MFLGRFDDIFIQNTMGFRGCENQPWTTDLSFTIAVRISNLHPGNLRISLSAFLKPKGKSHGFSERTWFAQGCPLTDVSWWVYCREFDGTNSLLTYHSHEKSPFWQVSFQINHRWLGYVPFFRLLQKYGLDWPPQGAKTGGSQIWFVASTCPSSS